MPQSNKPKTGLHAAAPELKLDCDQATFSALHTITADFGDIVRVPCPQRKHPQYLLSNPQDIKQVLVNNHRNYEKGVGFERVEMLLGNGIIVSDGAFWRRQRTMIQPAFSRNHIPRFFEQMKASTERLSQRWDALAVAGEPVDITTEMSRYALEIILQALFSEDLDSLAESNDELPFAFLVEDPTRNLSLAMRFRQWLKKVRGLIEQRRSTGKRPFDLLSMMMDASASKTGETMSDRELVDEMATMIIAGHETSAGTLNWAWYLLAEHPDCEARLSEESLSVCQGRALGFDELSKLHYAQQVIEETLRLYPPVWLYTRRAINEDTLQGIRIHAGDHIFLSPYLTQTLDTYWENPQHFDPDRFSEENKKQHVPYSFFPFSAGPRRCIGEYFSFIEMRTHLAMLCTRFRLRTVPGQSIELDPGINLRTRHALMMQLERKPQ